MLSIVYMIYTGLFDPAYAVGMFTESGVLRWTIELAAPVFLLIVGPLWALRAASDGWRARGLLVPAFVALLLDVLIAGGIRPYYGPAQWASASAYPAMPT